MFSVSSEFSESSDSSESSESSEKSTIRSFSATLSTPLFPQPRGSPP